MLLKFLHCNIEKGRFIDNIIHYIKTKDIDIVNFQEVTGGILSLTGIDCFQILKEKLGYDGECTKTLGITHDQKSYHGNAILWKKTFTAINKQILWLRYYYEVANPSELDLKDLPRDALCVKLIIYGKPLYIVNAHLAWGPNPKDENYKLKQGKMLYEFVKTIKTPFILSGDFNLTPDSQVVQWVNSLGINLTSKYNITNTLNPKTHRAKHLFPQGFAVDYVYTEKSIVVKDFKKVEEDLSDHFGLYLEAEV